MILLLLGSLSAASASDAVTGRVVKVLPLLLDLKGQDAISPSLYDRDAYQAYLRAAHERNFRHPLRRFVEGVGRRRRKIKTARGTARRWTRTICRAKPYWNRK